MALGVLLITNVVPVSAAEKIQSTKIESLSELDLDTYTQELMEADDGIQLYAPAPALTQFKLLLINSEKAGQETIQNSSSSMQVGSRLDHGGTWFQAITAEVGYAKTRYAYFNGVRMTLTASEPRDFALKNKNPCSACEFQAKQGISIWGIKLLFFSV